MSEFFPQSHSCPPSESRKNPTEDEKYIHLGQADALQEWLAQASEAINRDLAGHTFAFMGLRLSYPKIRLQLREHSVAASIAPAIDSTNVQQPPASEHTGPATPAT